MNKTLTEFGFDLPQPQKPPDWVKRVLEYLYYEQKQPWTKIAKTLNIRYQEFQKIRDYWDWEYLDYEEYLPDKKYKDENRLRRLHHDEKLSLEEIGRRFGTSGTVIAYWMKKHDIQVINHHKKAEFVLALSDNHPYPALKLNRDKEGRSYILEHQMVMLAEGRSVKDVFSIYDYEIHHKNRHKCDNRPSNLQMIPKGMHGRISAGTSESYSEGDVFDVVMYILRMGQFRSTKSSRDPKGQTGEHYATKGY